MGAHNNGSALVEQAYQSTVSDAVSAGVIRMEVGIRLSNVLGQTGRLGGTCHGMPVVADAAGVHQQVPGLNLRWQLCFHSDKACTAIAGVEMAIIKETFAATRPLRIDRPLHRWHGIVFIAAHTDQTGQVEIPFAVVLEGRQAGMFVKNLCRVFPAEGVFIAHALPDLTDDPPVRTRLTRQRQKRSLARDTALGIGHRAFALPPACGRKNHMPQCRRIGVTHVRDDHERTVAQGFTHPVTVGQAHCRIGGHDPDSLDLTGTDRLEQIDGLQARTLSDHRAAPEPLDQITVRWRFELQMGGKHVRQAAHLATAHGVRLSGDGKRPHPGPPDAPGEQVAVDDGVDLVGSSRRLIDPLRKEGDHALGAREQVIEPREVLLGNAAGRSDCRDRGCVGARRLQRCGIPAGMTLQKSKIRPALARQMGEQPIEQSDVTAGVKWQMQGRKIAAGRAPRIDHNDRHFRPARLGGFDTAVKNRMTPRQIGSDQHQHIGLFQILITGRHGITAESALVAGHRRGHAQPRVGVDVGRADVALHQLIGDIVVLRHQLAGHIKGDRVRTMLIDGLAQSRRDMSQGGVPFDRFATNAGAGQPPLMADGFPERQPF